MPILKKPFQKILTPSPRELLSDLDKRDYLIQVKMGGFLAPRFFASWKKLPVLDQGQSDYCTAFGSFLGWIEKLSGNMRSEVLSRFTNENAFFIAKKQMSTMVNEFWRKFLPQSITQFKGRNIKAALWNLNHGIEFPDGSNLFIDSYYRADFQTPRREKEKHFRELCYLIQKQGILLGGLMLRGSRWFDKNGRYTGSGRIEGGHLIVICGYNWPRKVVYFKNSWGNTWGKRGYGEIPMEKISDLKEIWSLGRSYFEISESEKRRLKVMRKSQLDEKNMLTV